MAFLVSGGYPDWATPQPRPLNELVEELRNAVRGHEGDVLISSENFFLFPAPAAVHEMLENVGALQGRRPSVVVYIRRQDSAHESWYNQTIKAQGETHDFDTCVERYWDLWDYKLQLDSWATAFGRDSLIVRPYESEQLLNASLADDFLDIIGADSTRWTIPSEHVNTGLNNDALEFQRAINALPLTVQEKRRFHRDLIELSAKFRGSGVFDDAPVTDGTQRRAILERYAASNRLVAETFLGRNVLFNEAPSDEPASTSTLTVEKLAAIVGWLLIKHLPGS